MKSILLIFSLLQALVWSPGKVVDDNDALTNAAWKSQEIPSNVKTRMTGKSYKKNCTVAWSDLRYLQLLHRNKDGKTQLGEMVCNKAIASKLITIFKALYEKNYRIERMVLIDDYDADDEKSMKANNTSCFNFRQVQGSKKLSKHSQGMAVDVNPLYNPFKDRKGKISPAGSEKYVNRSLKGTIFPLIDTSDLCYKLFVQNGARWGGAWKTMKDWQHFEF